PKPPYAAAKVIRPGAARTPYDASSPESPGGLRSVTSRRPSSSAPVIDALAPDDSRAGAATTTSKPRASASSASTVSPGEAIPSSFVTRTFMNDLQPDVP